MNNLSEMLIENPVIAAVRNDEDLENVLTSRAQIVFILYGNILNIADICVKLKDVDKTIFVHADMIDGLRGDMAGIQFIKKYAEPDGIITTKVNCIKYAKRLGLKTILRIFIIDSLSIKTGVKNIAETQPNAVEVMPGVASKALEKMKYETNVPIIAGGLVDKKKEVMDALSAGATAVSTTAKEIWEM
jgi:glycerol uptake operon antiterminator